MNTWHEFWVEDLRRRYAHHARVVWQHPKADDFSTTAYFVTALRDIERLSWYRIGGIVDRPTKTVKLIYRNYREQGKRAHQPNTPGWYHDHERFGEYPPNRMLSDAVRYPAIHLGPSHAHNG